MLCDLQVLLSKIGYILKESFVVSTYFTPEKLLQLSGYLRSGLKVAGRCFVLFLAWVDFLAACTGTADHGKENTGQPARSGSETIGFKYPKTVTKYTV